MSIIKYVVVTPEVMAAMLIFATKRDCVLAQRSWEGGGHVVGDMWKFVGIRNLRKLCGECYGTHTRINYPH